MDRPSSRPERAGRGWEQQSGRLSEGEIEAELERDEDLTRAYSRPHTSEHRTPTRGERAELEALYDRPWPELDRLRHLGTDRWNAERADHVASFRARPGGDGKARGEATLDTGEQRPLTSGLAGPAESGGPAALGLPAMYPVAQHVEGHLAGLMRETGAQHATLYLNRRPCPGEMGCDQNLPTMLPSDGTVVINYQVGEDDPPLDLDRETGPWVDNHGREWRAHLYIGDHDEREE